MNKRYNSFGVFMKNRFGAPVYKVSVDAGFSCPNRDGTVGVSGCIYCNNDCFRPYSCRPSLPVAEQIERGIDYIGSRYKAGKFLAYFQPYTNTYAPVDRLEKLYVEALANPAVIGLAIGTRPDAVDNEKIGLLQSLAKKYFILIEYGVQSIFDRTLEYINRGHDYRSFLSALEMTINRDIWTGVHIIAGFPTETREEMLATADELSHLPVDFLKIHHLQVVRNTPLASIYAETPFHVFGYEEYLDFITEFIERLSARIVIQRLFAAAPDHLLIAPIWNRNSQETIRDIENTLAAKDTSQGKKPRIRARI